MEKPSVVNILTAATTTGAGSIHLPWGTKRTFQAVGNTSAGAGSAINLTLATTVATDGAASDAGWKYVRANVTTLTGTGANVTVIMGIVKNS